MRRLGVFYFSLVLPSNPPGLPQALSGFYGSWAVYREEAETEWVKRSRVMLLNRGGARLVAEGGLCRKLECSRVVACHTPGHGTPCANRARLDCLGGREQWEQCQW
jgi:hypothetical protein